MSALTSTTGISPLLLQSTGGRLTGEVVQAVDAELAGLSAVPPALPWSGGGSRKR